MSGIKKGEKAPDQPIKRANAPTSGTIKKVPIKKIDDGNCPVTTTVVPAKPKQPGVPKKSK